ncbi:hypothetical protein [Ilumatobacter nonamiensis]|uniref:hypothetical protein n=1 Tax=Ilumatobacter nonamiensis TaxID=467093 RepID=UPI00034B1A8F|nr:hypothetical protein [Ilumatobacter nonamiensis]
MTRCHPARILVALVTVLVALVGPVASPVVSASGGDVESPTPVTVSDFYPEENSLSDCLGLVERPGCGSEERGGWGQTAVFTLLVVGLGIIFWRISVGVRRNRRE